MRPHQLCVLKCGSPSPNRRASSWRRRRRARTPAGRANPPQRRDVYVVSAVRGSSVAAVTAGNPGGQQASSAGRARRSSPVGWWCSPPPCAAPDVQCRGESPLFSHSISRAPPASYAPAADADGDLETQQHALAASRILGLWAALVDLLLANLLGKSSVVLLPRALLDTVLCPSSSNNSSSNPGSSPTGGLLNAAGIDSGKAKWCLSACLTCNKARVRRSIRYVSRTISASNKPPVGQSAGFQRGFGSA